MDPGIALFIGLGTCSYCGWSMYQLLNREEDTLNPDPLGEVKFKLSFFGLGIGTMLIIHSLFEIL